MLERDGSNIADVISKLEDDNFLTELVERTFSEVAGRDDLSFASYVNGIDNLLTTKLVKDGSGNVEMAFQSRLSSANIELDRTIEELSDAKFELTDVKSDLDKSNQLLEMAEGKIEHEKQKAEQLLSMAKASALAAVSYTHLTLPTKA